MNEMVMPNPQTKNCMFQYAMRNGDIVEDTDLISLDDAQLLRDKYIDDCKKRFREGEEPQMVLRIDCVNNTDYSKALVEIDYRDCILKNDKFYRVEETEIC